MAAAAAVKEKEGTQVALKEEAGLPAEMQAMMEEDAGQGFSQDATDRIMPFVALLQDMSPEVKKRDPQYVEGAEPGMILNKATKKLYAGNREEAEAKGLPMLKFQQCGFDHCIVEWVPRDNGGGFVARHDLQGTVEQTMQALGAKLVPDPKDPNKKVWKSGDGLHDMIDTRYHYGNIVDMDEGIIEPAVVAFSSTGHTASREWTTMHDNNKGRTKEGKIFKRPSWSKLYTVRSKPKKNTKGDFFVFAIDDAGLVTDPDLYSEGKKLNQAIAAGTIRAAEEPTEGGPSSDGDVPI